MKFYPDANNIDLRDEMKALLHGRVDLTPQGRTVKLRKLTNTQCICYDPVSGGSKGRTKCIYCDGEAYQFNESFEIMYIAKGVAPVYKPGFLANGQYPQSEYGYTDPNRATGFCEYFVFPDYERYTLQSHLSFDKLYELKVNDDGSLHYPLTVTEKWKVLNVTPLHGDFGRVEFFELSLEKEAIG